ncbi:hypothetical protein BKA62DRAFT_793620 [Auriculariales sp. MPI-PUGE-AT-0066]|nr:hypothetical protein BKA62DRAFT_793620 [Auriculariales sp. MPI-PUGE-AT-0066]
MEVVSGRWADAPVYRVGGRFTDSIDIKLLEGYYVVRDPVTARGWLLACAGEEHAKGYAGRFRLESLDGRMGGVDDLSGQHTAARKDLSRVQRRERRRLRKGELELALQTGQLGGAAEQEYLRSAKPLRRIVDAESFARLRPIARTASTSACGGSTGWAAGIMSMRLARTRAYQTSLAPLRLALSHFYGLCHGPLAIWFARSVRRSVAVGAVAQEQAFGRLTAARTGKGHLDKAMRYLLDSDATPDKSNDPIWILGVAHPGWEAQPSPPPAPRPTLHRRNSTDSRSDSSHTHHSTHSASSSSFSSAHPSKDLDSLDANPPKCSFWPEKVWTSDAGWGCMLRTGQSLLANTLVHLHLGRDVVFRFAIGARAFQRPSMAMSGKDFGKDVRQWFGPSTAAGTIK